MTQGMTSLNDIMTQGMTSFDKPDIRILDSELELACSQS